MISDLFTPKGQKQLMPSLPRDVKEAVSSCKNALQQALQNRKSRMTIEFPVGTKFGVEKDSVNKKRKRTSPSGDGDTPTTQDFDRSDRELARVFVEMFQPVGGERISVVFRASNLADLAKERWKDDSTAQCRIVSLDRKKAGNPNKKKTKPRGFAAKMAAEVDDDTSGPFQLPSGTEVALFVAPGPKELVVIERICNEVGLDTLVVLLNARLSSVNNFGSMKAAKLFQEDFESVFILAAAPQEASPGCILYRSYPNEWVLGRKPKVGPPKTIMTSPDRPSDVDCQAAFASIEISDIEKGVESTMENIASWFR